MSNATREKAIQVLENVAGHTATEVYCAVVDLRRNGELEDELIFRALLDYPDDMVAAAALYTLVFVYSPPMGIVDILLPLAGGDARDISEMPIQTQAIEGLRKFARQDARALAKLRQVAEDSATPEAPRARAWRCLADLFGCEWKREYTEAMILHPDSEASHRIRSAILQAITGLNEIPDP